MTVKRIDCIKKIHARALLAAKELDNRGEIITEVSVIAEIASFYGKAYTESEMQETFKHLRTEQLLRSPHNGHTGAGSINFITENGMRMLSKLRCASKDRTSRFWEITEMSHSPNVKEERQTIRAS